MPTIYDNISSRLLTALRDGIQLADRADFCVGYFNLRGWRQIADLVENLSEGCRLLVGMQKSPEAELRSLLSLSSSGKDLPDNAMLLRLKRQLAREFQEQLTLGMVMFPILLILSRFLQRNFTLISIPILCPHCQ